MKRAGPLATSLLALALASALPASSAATPCADAWVEMAPPVRGYHTAVHDPVRNRMIVFGGFDRSFRNETWTLSLSGPSTWMQLTTAGEPPSPRSWHTTIYDPVHDRLIVYGGGDERTTFSDLWALSLAGTPTWSRLLPDGTVPPRAGHSSIYVASRHSMIVFGGGHPGAETSDLWEVTLDESPSWSALAAIGSPPSPRTNHGALYDPDLDRMIVHGGSYLADTWTLSLAGTPAWSRIATTTVPPTRMSPALVLDRDRNRLVLFGGNHYGHVYSDTWTLPLSGSPAWSPLVTSQTPPRRSGASAVLDPVTSRMIVYGGSDGAFYRGETWALGLEPSEDWMPMPVAQDRPSTRQSAALVRDVPRDRMILFGGISTGTHNDVWGFALDGASAWTLLAPTGTPPSGRYGHSAVYDPVRDRVLVFGGQDGAARNDLWSLDLSGAPSWSQLMPAGSPPEARFHHAAIYDPIRDRMLVFGRTSPPDLWALELSGPPTWTPLTPIGIGPSSSGTQYQAVYDPVRDRMVLFGGTETWAVTLSGTLTWQAIPPSGTTPSPSAFGHTVVYDDARDRMIVFGGEDVPEDDIGVQHNRTYALDFTEDSWSQLAPCTLPAGRYLHTAIYDPVRDRMVIHGGSDPRRNDVWALEFGTAPPLEVPGRTAEAFELAPVFPNPARSAARLRFVLSRDATVRLDVLDVQGRVLATPVNGRRESGAHEVAWTGSPEPGIYWARLRGSNGTSVRRFAIVR